MSLLLSIFLVILAFILCLIASLILYTTWNYGKLDGLGFPVIKPFLFFGSNYMEHYRVATELSIERQKKYGKIYGAYDGRTPAIYISDPKILRLIRTVDFDYFRNHGFSLGNEPIMMELLNVIKDEKWKTVRTALTPIHTSGKIKQISKIIREFGEEYTRDLRRQAEENKGKIEKFDMKEYSAPLIIECIAKSFCGIEIPNARDPNNEFIKNIRGALMDYAGSENWFSTAMKMFPFLVNFLMSTVFGMSGDSLAFFTSVMKSSLEARVEGQVKGGDAAGILAEMIRKIRDNDPLYKSLGISETTVLAQAWQSFGASYIGIRDSLIALSYELAKDPEIQERIYEECSSRVKMNDDENMDTPYTTACVNEILRLYISFDKVERFCNRTWKHEESGITIPKGTQIFLPISAVHYNPEYFPDPMTFKPERFLDKTMDPNLVMTFGQGPRACIGSRVAIEIIRGLLIAFVMKFKFERRSDTKFIKTTGAMITVPEKPVYVDLVLRN